MAEKKVDIVLEALFRDRDNAFAKAKRSQLEMVREQKSAMAETERAEKDSLEKRLENLKDYYRRRIEMARTEEAKLRAIASMENGGAQLTKRIEAEQTIQRRVQDVRQKALFRETDQFLAARGQAEKRAAEQAARREMGGGGSSPYRLQREADRINAEMRGASFGGRGAANELAQVVKVTAAVKLGIDAVKIGTQIWKGDWEAVGESVKSLPLGLGAAAQSLEEIILLTTGWGAEIEKNNKRIAEGEKNVERIQKEIAASDRLNAMLSNLRIENLANPFEQELARAKAEMEEALAEVERIRKAGGDKSGERSAEAIARIKEENRQREQEIHSRWAAHAQAEDDAVVAARERREKEAKDREKEIRTQRLREASIASQIRQMQLRSLGEDLDAELEAIRSSFAERIELAKTESEKFLLEQQRALEEEAAIAGDRKRRSRQNDRGVEAVRLSDRFLGYTSRQETPAERAQVETARSTKLLLETAKRQEQSTREMARAIDRLGAGGSASDVVEL